MSEDDDFQSLKPVNINPTRPQRQQPDLHVVDKMLMKKDLPHLEKKGSHPQDVNITMAGAPTKKQSPEKPEFQSTVYQGTIQLQFNSQWKHWTASIFSGGVIQYFDNLSWCPF